MSTIGPLTPALLHRTVDVAAVTRRRHAALVDEDDDRLDALRAKLGDERVDRVGLVAEVDSPATPDGLTMIGVPSSVMPMNATLAPLKFRIA